MKKVALITGSSSGIGKETALELSKGGIFVIINYSNDEIKANLALEEIIKSGGEGMIIKADVSNEIEVKNMMRIIENQFGKLDFLVNNAGINIVKYIENYSLEDWNKVISVNLTGKFLCSKYALDLLKKSDTPRIINISSRLGTKPDDEDIAYCCAEAGIIMLTKALAIELSKYNIRVNTVSPSMTRTELVEKVCSKEEIEMIEAKNPLKRLGKTSDTAKLIKFLLSEDAEYINGENINVNGGILLV